MARYPRASQQPNVTDQTGTYVQGQSSATSGNTYAGTAALVNVVPGVAGVDVTGIENTAYGVNALNALTTSSYNTAVGYNALQFGNPDHCVAVGYDALRACTTGFRNVGIGTHALDNTTSGGENTAVGDTTLAANTTGVENTAIGTYAIHANTTGRENVGIGYFALYTTVTGNYNVAVGVGALGAQDGTADNLGIGYYAGGAVTTAASSVFLGSSAGNKPNNVAGNATTTGTRQTCVGYQTGQGSATQRTDIVAVGWRAVVDGNGAIAIGASTNAGAHGAVAIGQDHTGAAASTTTQNVIALGTALHQLQLKNNTTGAGSAALGANSPAITNTAPYTWIKMMSSDGSTVYVPCWK